MEAIAFQASSSLKMTWEGSVIPLPAVLVLWDTRVHIYPSDSSNEATDIEAVIYEFFGCWSVLWILDVDPDNSHIRLGGNFDNIGLGSDVDIIEDV